MRKTISSLVATLALFASLAPTQTITASITGTASDPSGAASGRVKSCEELASYLAASIRRRSRRRE